MASRRLMSLILVLAITANTYALTYSGSAEYTAGSGANQATIAVDFDLGDSFLFTYKWDGTATGQDALSAIDAAGALNAVTAYGGTFVVDLIYSGGSKYDYGADNTGWVYYTSSNGDNWDYSMIGFADRDLSNNDWDSWVWSNYSADWSVIYRTPGAAPVPEPATVVLLILGGLLARTLNRNKRKLSQ